MRRWPLMASIVVALAVAVMIGLGLWQLRRAEWKEQMLARYESAAQMPPVALPNVPVEKDAPLFRRASANCLEVVGWRAVAGRNAAEEPGWSHIASCRTGAEGPGIAVDVGWSKSPANPVWGGGIVDGIVAPDRTNVIRLVADRPAPGLVASARPNVDIITNNHRAYAVQWFVFAAIAAIIFVIAVLRRRPGTIA